MPRAHGGTENIFTAEESASQLRAALTPKEAGWLDTCSVNQENKTNLKDRMLFKLIPFFKKKSRMEMAVPRGKRGFERAIGSHCSVSPLSTERAFGATPASPAAVYGVLMTEGGDLFISVSVIISAGPVLPGCFS